MILCNRIQSKGVLKSPSCFVQDLQCSHSRAAGRLCSKIVEDLVVGSDILALFAAVQRSGWSLCNWPSTHADASFSSSLAGTYYAAVLENRADFEGKIVVDVGAGSGILSLFAAQAGAKMVYAIEASDMAQYAKRLAAGNGEVGSRITVSQNTLVLCNQPLALGGSRSCRVAILVQASTPCTHCCTTICAGVKMEH